MSILFKPSTNLAILSGHSLGDRLVMRVLYNVVGTRAGSVGTSTYWNLVNNNRGISVVGGGVHPAWTRLDGGAVLGAASTVITNFSTDSMTANLGAAPFTVMVRLKPPSSLGFAAGLVMRPGGWALAMNGLTKVGLYIDRATTAMQAFSVVTQPTDFYWLTCVYDGTVTAVNQQFYIDGILQAVPSTPATNGVGAASNDIASAVSVGALAGNVGGSSSFGDFTGHIGDVAIWRRGLSAVEIRDYIRDPYAMLVRPSSHRHRHRGLVGFTNANVTVGITGVDATGASGDVATTGDSTATLTGVSSTSAVGNVATGSNATVALTGVSATGVVGTVLSAGNITVGITGVSSSATVGSVSIVSSARSPHHIVYRQATSAQAGVGSSSVSTTAFTSGTGNCLVVAVADAFRPIVGIPVTDNHGNVFQLAWVRGVSGTASPTALYYATNIVGGAGHIVTFTPQGGNDACAIAVAEFSGVDRDAPFNLVSTAASAAAPHISGSITTTSPAEQLIIGAGGPGNQQCLPPASWPGFFTDEVAVSAFGAQGVLASYAIVAAQAAYRYEYTYENGSGDADACGIATFRGGTIALVQSTYVQGILSVTTDPITTTPGNFLVIIASKNFGTFASPITDSSSNTWQTAWAVGHAACYYAENIAGGAGHTLTATIANEGFDILNRVAIAVLEFSGVATSSALDKISSANTTSEPRSSGTTGFTSQGTELLIGGGSVSNIANIPYSTINGDFTDVAALRSVISGGVHGIILSYQITDQPDTYEYGFSNGVDSEENVGIASFKAFIHEPDGDGVVGDGIEPPDDTSICGADIPLFYAELRTNSGMVSYSWVDQPINELTIQRLPRIVEISPLRRELSDWSGRVVINSGHIRLTDYDGVVRAMIRSNTIIRKQLDFYLIDKANLGSVPFRCGQYLITSYKLSPDMTVDLGFEDRFGGDSLRDLLTKPLPYRKLDTSFNTTLPAALNGKGEPIPYGLLSDQDLGFPSVQVWYTGEEIMPDLSTWYQGLIAGCATSGPFAIYGSDGSLTDPEGEPRQVEIDPGYFDTDIAVPGQGSIWTEFFGDTLYRVINGRRYTVMYFRKDSATGEDFKLFATSNGAEGVPVHVNMGGIEDIGNGTGNVITSLYEQWQHLITNFVEQNHATDESWYEIPLTQNDPAYSIIDTISVQRAKARSAVRLGRDSGFQGAFVIGHDLARIPLGEWFQRICLGGDVDMGVDRHGRMFLSMEDPSLVPVKDFTIADTMLDTYQPPEKDLSKLANLITLKTLKTLVQINASVILRPSSAAVSTNPEWLTATEDADDGASIIALGGRPAGVREFHYEDWVTRDFTRKTQASVQTYRLARSKDGPDYHVVETDLCGLDVELGDLFTITHYAGLHASTRRVRCTAIELMPPDPFSKQFAVRLTGYDVSGLSDSVVVITDYPLTVTGGSGDGSYEAGAIITIVADPPASGMVFYRWDGGTGIANRTSSSTTITMPAVATTVTATYLDDITLFTLTVVNGSGDGNYAAAAVVAIVAGAGPSGYTFYVWTGDTAYVDDVSDATTTVTMPSSSVLVTATYAWFGIELAWDAGASSDAITGYLITWGTASGVYTSSLDVGLVTDYHLTGLTDAVTYYLVVQAYNAAGYSAYSDEVSGVPSLHLP